MKILVVGGDSQIGSAFASCVAQSGEHVVATTRRIKKLSKNRIYLDLFEDTTKWIPPNSTDVALICAGITNTNLCTKDPLGTALVNVDATCNLIKTLLDRNYFVIYLSSNQVFDGSILLPSHEDSTSPITEYGKQKVAVEQTILSQKPDHVAVLRVTKILMPDNPLLQKWVELLRKGEKIYPFYDMYMAPVPLSCVVSILHLMAARRLPGIFHLSSEENISYAHIAQIAAKILKVKSDIIQPVSVVEAGYSLGSFPLMTALSIERLKTEYGISPPEGWWTIEKVFMGSYF